jgi:hypothetical protein
MENQRLLTQEQKNKILNVTLDNAAVALLAGAGAAVVFRLGFRSKGLALFSLGYALGTSLAKSEEYLKENL